MSPKRPRDDGERAHVSPVRALGGETRDADRTPSPPADPELRSRARAILEGEFARVLEIKEKLVAESETGHDEKGRDALRSDEKIRNLLASLEGMHGFALAMGLISPAESREMFAAAMKSGLFAGGK